MLAKSRPKYLTLGLLGAMMALLIVGLMYTQGTASAQSATDGQQTVSTGTTIVPTGAAPTFECKWELPDMQPFVVGSEAPDNLIQYDVPPIAGVIQHIHDDDPALPSVTPACDGPPATLPTQPDGVTGMITVMPLPHTSPLVPVPERFVQLWAAVDHPNGIQNIDDVYWKIFHPDGTFKVQVHGTKIGDSDAVKPSPGLYNNGTTSGDSMAGYDHDNDAAFGTVGLSTAARRIAECQGLGHSNTAGSMFEAAWHTGQVSASAIDDVNLGIIAKCQENEKAVYYAKFAVHKDQPCGMYKVEAHALANGNEAPVLTNYIDVVCFWYLNTDFSGLSWGDITPGHMQMISGDLIWDAGGVANPNSNGPTVHNGGNHPMGIRIHFSEMLQDVAFGPKKIDRFDACFGKHPSVIECVGQSDILDAFGIPIDAIHASQITGFGPDPLDGTTADTWNGDFDQVLCANDLGKLDLSIHPYANLPSGSYSGTFDIWAHTVHDLDFDPCYQDQEHIPD